MIATLALHADPLGLLVAFGAGMLSFVSPCVLPMVPGYVSMVSGLSAAELRSIGRPALVGASTTEGGTGTGPSIAEEADVLPTALDLQRQRARLLRGILLFIAGFTVVFTMLGASASAVGHLLVTHKPALQIASGVLIMVFGAMLVLMASGLPLPLVLGSERRLSIRPSRLGAWAPPLMGVAFAFAWTPCTGPVLGSVLGLAAGTGGSATSGIALLLAYSIGLGVPFLLFGMAFGRMTDLLARFRSRLRLVDLVGGAVLIAFGVLLLTGNVAILSDHISNWLRDLHLNRLSSS